MEAGRHCLHVHLIVLAPARTEESSGIEGEDFVMTLLSRCNGHDILESCGCGGLRTAKRPSLGRFEAQR